LGRAGDTLSVADVSDAESAERVRGNSRKYIIDTLDGRSIGQIDYYDLNWQSRSAWTSILIADTDYWGGGYGSHADPLHYLFAQMGLHSVSDSTRE
jgi:RimJ/RimL family protein N-acetyltransferase